MTIVSTILRDEITANMQAAKERMWVRIKGGNRELTHYIAEVVLAVLTIGAYVILYKTLGLPSSLGAAVTIGGAMIAFWTNIIWHMSAQGVWAKEMGSLEVTGVAAD